MDNAASDEVQFRGAAREVEVLAPVHDRRTCGAHMHFLGAVGIQELYRFTHLRSSDDAVVYEQELLPLDEFVHGDKLHLCNLVSHGLALRHEAARPGGGILYKRTCERDTAAVCVAYRVGNAGIRDAADEIHVRQCAVLDIVLRHDLAVAGTHGLHGDSLVDRVRIAVVGPQEGADPEVLLAALAEHFRALGGDLHDLSGEHLAVDVVAQLLECEALKGNAVAVVAPADDYRQSAVLVPGGDYSVLGEDKQGHGALDLLLGVANAVNDVVLLCDKRADERGGVDLSAAHCFKACAGFAEKLAAKFLIVVDYADVADRVGTQSGFQQDRLRIRVAYASYAEVAGHSLDVALELCAERRVLNAVNASLEALLSGIRRHAAAPGAEVGMVVRAEEYVADTAVFSCCSEKSAHIKLYRLFSVCIYRHIRGRAVPAPECRVISLSLWLV